MKALLHGVGDGPWGHDLVELGRRAAESTADLWDDELEARLLRLSRHYIPARYPDAHAGASPGEHYGAEDSKQAVADARGVLAWVDDAWRVLVTTSEEE
jgi:HEPN domain-containing protein